MARWKIIAPLAALGVGVAIGALVYPRDCIVAERDGVEVVSNPTPLNYPTTNPLPNSVVGTLAKGQHVRVWYTGYGKDYAYYKVRLQGGIWGYLISGRGVHVGRCE